MSLMAGLTVLVKIIRSDVRVSFVSGPVTSQSVGSIAIEADPSLSFVVPVPPNHIALQRAAEGDATWGLSMEENGMEISLANPSSIIFLFFIHFPRVSNKISDRRVTQRLSSFGDGFSYTATTKRIHRQRSTRRLWLGINTVESVFRHGIEYLWDGDTSSGYVFAKECESSLTHSLPPSSVVGGWLQVHNTISNYGI